MMMHPVPASWDTREDGGGCTVTAPDWRDSSQQQRSSTQEGG